MFQSLDVMMANTAQVSLILLCIMYMRNASDSGEGFNSFLLPAKTFTQAIYGMLGGQMRGIQAC